MLRLAAGGQAGGSLTGLQEGIGSSVGYATLPRARTCASVPHTLRICLPSGQRAHSPLRVPRLRTFPLAERPLAGQCHKTQWERARLTTNKDRGWNNDNQ